MQTKLTDMKFLISSHNPGEFSRPHNRTIENSLVPVFFQDSSMQKSLNQQLKKVSQQNELTTKLSQLHVQTKRRQEAEKNLKINEKFTDMVESKKKLYETMISEYTSAAIKIQKVARGFLTRIKYDDLIITYKNAEMEERNNELESLVRRCYYSLGTNTEPVTEI